MKKTIYSIIILGFFFNLSGQITLEITNLEIENLDTTTYEGPMFNFDCRLINNTSDTVLLFPHSDSILIIYNLDNKEYKIRCWSLNLKGGVSSPLYPGDTSKFTFDRYILFPTRYSGTYADDYYKPIIKLLPTLQLFYKSSLLQSIVCNKVLNVEIKE